MNLLGNLEEKCELQGRVHLLRNIPVFAGLSPEFLQVLAYLCERRIFTPSQVILKQEESAETAVIVVRGDARLELGGRHIAMTKNGSCIGGLALLGQFRWLYSLRAETEVECLLLPRHKFLPQFMARPEAFMSVARGLVGTVVDWEQHQLELPGETRSYGLAML